MLGEQETGVEDLHPLKNDAWKTFAFPFGSRQVFRGQLLNFGM